MHVTQPRKPDSVRSAFTMIEAMVVLVIVLLLAALLMPATRNARVAARRTQCKNNLKQMGLAFHNYHDAHRSFPAGYRSNDAASGRVTGIHCPDYQKNGPDGFAWGFSILPQLDQASLFEAIRSANEETAAWTPERLGLVAGSLAAQLCPSVTDKNTDFRRTPIVTTRRFALPTSHYLAVAGASRFVEDQDAKSLVGIFGKNSRVRVGDIPDGTSNTAMIVEHCPSVRDRTWYAVVPGSTVCKRTGAADCATADALVLTTALDFSHDHAFALSGLPGEGFAGDRPEKGRSNHTGGMHILLADGSVRFLSETMDFTTWQSLCTKAGGEKLGEF